VTGVVFFQLWQVARVTKIFHFSLFLVKTNALNFPKPATFHYLVCPKVRKIRKEIKKQKTTPTHAPSCDIIFHL
jgi:hypothetical protein